MQYGVRVKLLSDLTQYHRSLRQGSVGVTIAPAGDHARYNDRFVSVQFSETVLDCLWDGLEIIDDVELSRLKAGAEALERSIKKTAKNAVKTLGPNGGFKHLSFEYIDEKHPETQVHLGTGFREEAAKYERWLAEAGTPIKIERMSRRT